MKKLLSSIALLSLFVSLNADQIFLLCPTGRDLRLDLVATYQVNQFLLKAAPKFTKPGFTALSQAEQNQYKTSLQIGFKEITTDPAVAARYDFEPVQNPEEAVEPRPVEGPIWVLNPATGRISTRHYIDPTDANDGPMSFIVYRLYTYQWGLQMRNVGRLLSEIIIVDDFNPFTGEVGQYAQVIDEHGQYLTAPHNISIQTGAEVREVPFSVVNSSTMQIHGSQVSCSYDWQYSYGAYPLVFKGTLPAEIQQDRCTWGGSLINANEWYGTSDNTPVVCEN